VKINVHIERVVLEDIAVESTAGVRTALRTELARRFAEGGLDHEFRQAGAHAFVNTGNIAWNGSRSEARLGRQIANAIYGGIGAKK
jgi:hypothetical protein